MSTAMESALVAYEGRTPEEAADLEGVRAWLPSTGDAWDRATSLHFTASALIVHPPSRRVLLRWHARQEAWLQVGGHGDPGETGALAIALREAREETGLSDLVPWSEGALLHLVIVPVKPSAKEQAHEHVDLRFVFFTEHPEDARPENPTALLRWLSIEEALAATEEPNLRESIQRAVKAMDRSRPADVQDTVAR